MEETGFYKVASVRDLAPGTGMKVEIDGDEIAVFNYQGGLYAINDLCPHRGAPLSEGFLEDGKVFCPWHCFDFNLRTGECLTVPSLRVQSYEVKLDGDDLYVRR